VKLELKLKFFLKKIVYGFLFGLGLSLAVILSSYIYDQLVNDYDSNERKEYSNDAELTVIDQHHIIRDSAVVILAKIKNQGSDTWKRINLEAEIFDKEGVFVDECSTFIREKLRPAVSENFNIFCSGWKSKDVNDIGKISIKIKDADFVPEKN